MKRIFTVKNTVIGYGILLAVSFPGYYLAIRNYSGRTLDLISIAIYYFVVTGFAIIIGEYFVIKLWLNKSVKYKKIEIISKWEKKIYVMIFLSFQIAGMIVLIVLQNASILFLLSGCCLTIVWLIRDTIYISADDLIYNARRIQINQVDKVTKVNRTSLKFVFKNGYTYIIKCRNLRIADEIVKLIFSAQKSAYGKRKI
jgi:hypothetical protein